MNSSNPVISKTLTRAMLSACLAGGLVAYSTAANAEGDKQQSGYSASSTQTTSNTQAASGAQSGQQQDQSSAQAASGAQSGQEREGASNIQATTGTQSDQQQRTSDLRATSGSQPGQEQEGASNMQATTGTQPGQQQRSAASSQQGSEAGDNATLGQVDQNQDQSLVWTEIYAVYDDELADAGWDEDYVFDTYDLNNDAALDDNEYAVFVGGLTAAAPPQTNQQSGDAMAGANQNQPSSTQANQSAPQIGQNQQANQGTDPNAEAPVIVNVVAITEVPVTDLEDRDVINFRGENLGEVEQVVTNPDGTISGLVVGVGGFWGIGDKDVFVPADEVQVSGDYVVWETYLDEDTLEDMPHYQLEEYSIVEP